MVVELIQTVEEADSSESLLEAVQALAAAREPEALSTLITVLGYNNPGAAVAAVDGLIELGEIAVEPLLEQLDGYNYGARAWAIRALAGIGDPRGLEILLEAAANDFALSVRRAAARGLGTIRWEALSAERTPAEQQRVAAVLMQASEEDPEWVVRYAAVVGLQGLASAVKPNHPEWVEQILTRLKEVANTDETLAVCARALLAIQELSIGT
ncbi:MAG: HEAT repeat domain-containing protein [Cyanobacteriota bacterium]|nr:HEAT repeat domain-containing protein [Cyanobacteriota bacterium]